MLYQGEKWVKASNRPDVNSDALLIEDGSNKIVKVVAHSSFDERAFFADSDNLKGVFKLHDGFIETYVRA